MFKTHSMEAMSLMSSSTVYILFISMSSTQSKVPGAKQTSKEDLLNERWTDTFIGRMYIVEATLLADIVLDSFCLSL